MSDAEEVVMSALAIVNETPVLEAIDRCDKCPARAVIRVRKTVNRKNLELDFCMHDFNTIKRELQSKGFEVLVDNRDTLT